MRDLRPTGDRNQCPTCGEYFNSSSSFDFHRTGRFGVDRRCRTVPEMVARGMTRNAAGFWIKRDRPAGAPRTGAAQSAPEGGRYHPAEITRASALPGRPDAALRRGRPDGTA